MHWDSIKFALKQPVRAERGWGRVGHALGFTRIGQVGPRVGRVGPSGAVGPSRAEWGRLGVGEGLGMHWDSIMGPRGAGSGGGPTWPTGPRGPTAVLGPTNPPHAAPLGLSL